MSPPLCAGLSAQSQRSIYQLWHRRLAGRLRSGQYSRVNVPVVFPLTSGLGHTLLVLIACRSASPQQI